MNKLIADFPNKRLYDNRLISDPSVAKRLLIDLPTIEIKSEEAKDVLEPVVVFFDTAGCEFYERNEAEEKVKGLAEGSKSNANEAEVAVRWAKQLVHFISRGILMAGIVRCPRGTNCHRNPLPSSSLARL